MPDQIITPDRTVEDYKSGVKPTWCPGCGDFGVLNAVYNSLRAKGYAPQDVVLVSGIGCSSRLPFFSSTYGFHTVHGRTMPIATGIKVANPAFDVTPNRYVTAIITEKGVARQPFDESLPRLAGM